MSFYPHAIWSPGPIDKQGYPGLAVNARRGVICHSMVGAYVHAKARLDSADRASWHFSVLKDGTVHQHYDTMAVTWHAGVKQINGIFVGIEHEGGGYFPNGEPNFSEPLTAAQLEASIALVTYLADEGGYDLVRDDPGRGLHEHNEYYATACPSGRIPWEEYTVTAKDKAEVIGAIKGYVDMKLIQLIAYLQQTGVKCTEK